jgi:pimeloyl-ACP methyl ester carboxylesterase
MTGTTAPITRSAVKSSDGTAIAYASLGAGPGVIVVGGALRAGRDYLPLARELARTFTVHVVDRRGRGDSGPQGAGYSIDKERNDLLALQAATGASAVFGHSYGGLIALETGRQTDVFSDVVVYEPGVSVSGSLRVDWMPRYRALLEAGDTRGAFASMVRQSGFAPALLTNMPQWFLRSMLRIGIRGQQWQQVEPLLEPNLAEHDQVARLDDGTLERYRSIGARVLLLGGQQSPPFITTELFDGLTRTIPDSAVEILDGLDHTAPDTKAPGVVAERIREHLRPR